MNGIFFSFFFVCGMGFTVGKDQFIECELYVATLLQVFLRTVSFVLLESLVTLSIESIGLQIQIM